VTNGVGALSAINGVGGSYSEHVPVVCIAGSIPLRSIDRGLGMHHTMADGTYDHFLDAYAHVTAAHVKLTPRNAATEIDRLILTAWRERVRSFSPTRPATRSGCVRAVVENEPAQ
jgi:indolepyruvate decarboxylase